MTALTFEEARERSRLLDVRGYRIEFDVTRDGEAFGSAALAETAAAGTADGTVPPAAGLVRTLCRHGFPHHAVDAATVRAGELCLATGALTGSLRRLLAGQLGDLRRSVAVRSAG